MDQVKIGAFIARCRKDRNLTQLQLAELLGITSQAISKWENGRGMPDVSLLQPLCDILGISVNELFSADYISKEDYKEKAEENISKLLKENQLAYLKPVKSLYSICVNTFLVVVVVEVLIGIVGYFFDKEIFEVMVYNASVWLVFFGLSFGKLLYDKKKKKYLKDNGRCVECLVNELVPSAWVRVGNYITGRVRCTYIYDGKEYDVKSGLYVFNPFVRKEEIIANLYYDENNHDKYVIEVLMK